MELKRMNLSRSSNGDSRFNLDDYLKDAPIPMLALLMATVQQSEKGKKYADERDTPTTGYAPWLFIHRKPAGCLYGIMDTASGDRVYVAMPLEKFLVNEYKFPRTQEESLALDKIVTMSSEELLQKIDELRTDKNAGVSRFSDLVDEVFCQIDEYFESAWDMTYEQAKKKYGAVIVS